MAKLTKQQRNAISGQFIVNKNFRVALLKDPKKAAATLGIELSGDQAQEIKDYKQAWQDTAKKADKALRTKLQGILPVFIMD